MFFYSLSIRLITGRYSEVLITILSFESIKSNFEEESKLQMKTIGDLQKEFNQRTLELTFKDQARNEFTQITIELQSKFEKLKSEISEEELKLKLINNELREELN